MAGPARTWLTVGDAARLLGVSVPTLRRWDKRGKLVARRHPVSGFRAYARADVDRLASSFQVTPGSHPGFEVDDEKPIGREREVAALCQMLSPGCLVTLLGPAGVGKTTLARVCAPPSTERSRSNVRFCDLTHAKSEQDVLGCIAAELDIELEMAGAAASDQLARAIAAAGDLLLVLDNLEQVADATRPLLEALARHRATVRVLGTSRHRLLVDRERCLEVSPLAVPERAERDAGRVASCAAVALLLRRARQAGAGDLRADLPVLAEITRRLDGLPLALELAGAQLALLPAAELLRRLSSSGALRRVRRRGGRSRHDSLEAALEGSWELLDGPARSMLAQLSVFRGGFTAADAEAVVQLETGAPDVLEVLASLQDRSLVRADPGGAARFHLLLTVQEYASNKLALAGMAESTRARHALRFAELAKLALLPPPLSGSETTRRLVTEQDNVRAAYAASAGRDPRAALALAVGVEHALKTRMPIAELTALLEAAIRGASRDRGAREILGRARAALGRLLCERGQLSASALQLSRALTIARTERDLALQEHVLGLQALVHVLRGRRTAALATVARAERLVARDDTDPAHRFTFAHHASVLHEVGRLEDAERSYLLARSIAEAIGDTLFAARISARLARVWSDAGHWERAERSLDDALAVLEASDDRYLAWALSHRAMHLRRRGSIDAAREAYERALPLFAERGATAPEVLHRGMLAAVQADLGREVDALASLATARAGAERLRDRQLAASTRIAAAHLDLLAARRFAANGERRAARRALGAARKAVVRGARVRQLDKDVRAAAELLEQRIAEHKTGCRLPHAPALIVEPRGAWFTPPSGRRVELPAGSPLMRLVASLAAARSASPGRACPREALLAAGWPGERVIAAAGAQRIYAAIAELRGRGLDRVLQSRDDGYLLDPATPLILERSPDQP